MTETFVCKGTKLAAFLLSKGCKCYKVDVDNQNPTYVVFLFEKDDLCRISLKEWESKKF